MPQIEPNVELDERIWQAWLRKNKAQDKMRLARRVRVIKLVSLVLVVSAVLWRAYTG